MKIKKSEFPLCRAHRQPAWQAVVEERGHGASKRWIFVPICRECRQALPAVIRKKRGTPVCSRLLPIWTSRELARVRNAIWIAAIAAKSAATRATRRTGHTTGNSAVAEAVALAHQLGDLETPPLADLLEGNNDIARTLSPRWL